jgi:predicted transcriptional regulator
VGRGFGDLETVVMDRLWAADGATTVRDVLEQLVSCAGNSLKI